jgi:hypothetical protein
MNPLIQFKKATPLFLIVFVLAFLVLSPRGHAVSPAPDGGYTGGNTAEGDNALLSLTTGGFNTALGFFSLRSDTTNSFNTAVGAGTLLANTADSNTATGAGALLSNTTGASNTANGAFALFSSTTASFNTANGQQALLSNTTGHSNTADGQNALTANTTGAENVATGVGALGSNTTGNNNTALGWEAGSNLTGDNNIDIGHDVGGATGESNTIRIGNTNIATTIIRGISGQTIPSGGTVLVASNGQLGTLVSSKRFKQEIKPMDKASEALFALKPVTFRYKKGIDPQGISQFGLVAEDVEKVNPDLVLRDKEGKTYSVRYDQVNAMLLNEFLKEHKAFLEEHRTVEELKKQVSALTVGLQKVSAQLEASKPAPQVVNNP